MSFDLKPILYTQGAVGMKPNFAETNDSFTTGAVRGSQAGKPRIDLISPYAAERIGIVNAHGAENYGERNFEKGMPFSRVLASIERHLKDYKKGKADEDHLAQLAWNVIALLHLEEMVKRGLLPLDLDDLPHYETRTADELARYYDSLPKPRKKTPEPQLGEGAHTVLGIDCDKCGTTDGVTPIPNHCMKCGGSIGPHHENVCSYIADVSHHRTPELGADGQGVYGIPFTCPEGYTVTDDGVSKTCTSVRKITSLTEPGDEDFVAVRNFDKATEQENRYDGDWNRPDQTPGFWRIKGENPVLFYESDYAGFTDSGLTPAQARNHVDSGFFVPNEWSE